MKIFKQGLSIDGIVDLPAKLRILSHGIQYGRMTIWFRHMENEEYRKYKVRVLATGEYYAEQPDWVFVGTEIEAGGELIWHYFLEPVQ